jgi:hypothetical protein
MFPQATDPKGDPDSWTEEEMRRWLNAVSFNFVFFSHSSAFVWKKGRGERKRERKKEREREIEIMITVGFDNYAIN